MLNYKEQLQQNNNELTSILDMVNSLPEVGSSGEGDENKTCLFTLTIDSSVQPSRFYGDQLYFCFHPANDEITNNESYPIKSLSPGQSITVTGKRGGVFIVPYVENMTRMLGFNHTGIEIIDWGNNSLVGFIPNAESCSLTIYDAD